MKIFYIPIIRIFQFLGFGMWSGPPYCETNDLMNRIRKINFSPDEEKNQQFDLFFIP